MLPAFTDCGISYVQNRTLGRLRVAAAADPSDIRRSDATHEFKEFIRLRRCSWTVRPTLAAHHTPNLSEDGEPSHSANSVSAPSNDLRERRARPIPAPLANVR